MWWEITWILLKAIAICFHWLVVLIIVTSPIRFIYTWIKEGWKSTKEILVGTLGAIFFFFITPATWATDTPNNSVSNFENSSSTSYEVVTNTEYVTPNETRSLPHTSIRESLTGSCSCPYDFDKAGRSCGGRSAYSRPGGSSPICYQDD